LFWVPERLLSSPSPGAKFSLSRWMWYISFLFSLDHFYLNLFLWCHTLRKYLCSSSLDLYGCLLHKLCVHILQQKMASCEAASTFIRSYQRELCSFSQSLKCAEGCTRWQVCNIHYTVLQWEAGEYRDWGSAKGERHLCECGWRHPGRSK